MAVAASAYPQVYDSQGRRLCVLDFAYSVVATEVLLTPDGQGQETLSFQFPASHSKRPFIQNERRIRCAGSEFIVRRVVDGWDSMQSMAASQAVYSRWQSTAAAQGAAGIVTTQVTCEAAWYDLGGMDPIPSLAITQSSPALAVQTILQGTGWRFVGTDLSAPNDFSIGQPMTRLAALRQVQATWGGELEFDSVERTVGLWAQRGAFCPVVYAYRHNLGGNTRTLDTETLATRAWVYGAGNVGVEPANGGAPYIEDYSFFDAVGWPRETRAVTLVNSQLTDPWQLLAWGRQQLSLLSDPKVTYELAVVQLPQDPVPGVGDTVIVHDTELGLHARPRVARRDLDVLEPEQTQLQLDNALPSLPTAQSPVVGGAPAPVLSDESVVLGGQGQSYTVAPIGSNPNVGMDETGVWGTRADGSQSFFLSATTGILTAQAVIEPGSTVPAPTITGQLTDAQIATLAAAKLTGQITSTQITDGAISTPKLAAGAVTTATLAASSVLAGNIASGTITSVQIAAATIVGANVAASTITADKLQVGSLSAITANLGSITAGSLSAVTISSGTITASTITASTINFPNGVLDPTLGLALQAAGSSGASGYGMQFFDGLSPIGYIQQATDGVMTLSATQSDGSEMYFILGGNVGLQADVPGVSPTVNSSLFNSVNGNARFWGTVSSNGTVLTSDARLKADVRPHGPALADVRRLRSVHYRSTRHGQRERSRAGLVAQEVREVLPHAVVADDEGMLGVDPMAITAALVEAVKDLASRVDDLYDSQLLDCPAAALESASDDAR